MLSQMRGVSGLKLFLSQCLVAVTVLTLVGCNSSRVEDAIDAARPPGRKTIDTSITGINAFVNDPRYGSISAQFNEVKNTLRLNFVRVLFDWNDGIQGSPSATPDFGFYDAIIDGVPAGMDVLVVVTNVPSWVQAAGGNPRTTFVDRWVRVVAERYRTNGKIIGYQIWNEPNMPRSDNAILDLSNSAANYVEMLARAYSVIKDVSPNKLVLNAATTAINQNYPETLNYNRAMRDAGALNFTDRWSIHYYGKQFENVLRPGGVEDFLDGLPKGIWVTETGNQGVNQQLAYGEQVWPFLKEKVPGIERFYIYQFTESTPPDVTYGLKNLSPDLPVSDLYVWLRDR